MTMNEPSQKGEPTAKVDTQQASATNLSFPRPTQPVVTEIISAAQRGDLVTIRELVESGRATVNDRDSQNYASPLGGDQCPAGYLSLPHRAGCGRGCGWG
ncbi:hypothetical protein EDD17DRAFT_832671 [Pisolithus thermaeus]|nr:hypothetical protein EDD17DRAFT_832671 [Pisolithus thermaeus]